MDTAMQPATVLVVEDDFLVRSFAAEVLAENGFGVIEARNAEEALAKLERHPEVAVLFTDVNMPGALDGLDLAREVASRYPHVSRLVTSGRIRPNAIEYARFLPKPYRPDEVVQNIRELLDGGDAASNYKEPRSVH
jgi:DNA-binding NtrC family response regulator